MFMVGMSLLRMWDQEKFGSVCADDGNDFKNVCSIQSDVAVGDSQIQSKLRSEDLGGSCRFSCTDRGIPTSSKFSAAEIEDPDGFSKPCQLRHRSTASEFHIIWVSADSEEIEFHNRFLSGMISSVEKYRRFVLKNNRKGTTVGESARFLRTTPFYCPHPQL